MANEQQNNGMNLGPLKAKVEQAPTIEAGCITLCEGISERLKQAAGRTHTDESLQQWLLAFTKQLDGQTTSIANAILLNTPEWQQGQQRRTEGQPQAKAG